MAKTLSVKANAPELLERQLSRRAKKEEYGIIGMDPPPKPTCRLKKRRR
jgi:hypothetical protein